MSVHNAAKYLFNYYGETDHMEIWSFLMHFACVYSLILNFRDCESFMCFWKKSLRLYLFN